MSLWKQFEKDIQDHSKTLKVTVIKLREDRTFRGGRILQRPTEFDFCAAVDGAAVFFDAKCVEGGDKFYPSRWLASKSGKNQHQALSEARDWGAIAGLLVWLVRKRAYVWAPLEALDKPVDLHLPHQSHDEPINLRRLLWMWKNAMQ